MQRIECLEFLEEYGVGPNMLRLISYFWNNAELVYRANGYYSKPFEAYREVTQGGPFSLCIFNVMVSRRGLVFGPLIS